MAFDFNANEVFQMAIEIEENGRLFYQKAQELVKDPEVKSLFSDLEQREIEHRDRFGALKAELPESARESTVWDPQGEINQYLKMAADMHVFRAATPVEEQLAQVTSAVDALKLAMQFEKDSILFFLLMQDETEKGKGKELITQLTNEEKGHLRMLSKELVRITKGKEGS
jgi:rubrerythrin